MHRPGWPWLTRTSGWGGGAGPLRRPEASNAAAEVLGVDPGTATRERRGAQAFLRRELEPRGGSRRARSGTGASSTGPPRRRRSQPAGGAVTPSSTSGTCWPATLTDAIGRLTRCSPTYRRRWLLRRAGGRSRWWRRWPALLAAAALEQRIVLFEALVSLGGVRQRRGRSRGGQALAGGASIYQRTPLHSASDLERAPRFHQKALATGASKFTPGSGRVRVPRERGRGSGWSPSSSTVPPIASSARGGVAPCDCAR